MIFHLAQTEAKGQHLLASRDIGEGELIVKARLGFARHDQVSNNLHSIGGDLNAAGGSPCHWCYQRQPEQAVQTLPQRHRQH